MRNTSLALITYWAAAYFILIAGNASGQEKGQSVLERTVSVTLDKEPPRRLLNSIEGQANVVFSYSPKVLEGRDSVSLFLENKSIRYVLFNAFGESMTFREKGKYVILNDNRQELIKPFGERKQVVEGYILDTRTGEKVDNATIYDRRLLISATTNEYGYFKLEVPYGEKVGNLRIKKEGYADTTITPIDNRSSFVSLGLPRLALPETYEVQKKKGWNLNDIKFPKWFLSDVLKTNARNVGDTLYSPWQVSLFPNIGTNRKLSGSVINGVSFNIFAGYSRGVRIMELGYIANIVKEDARYFMASGVNFVGGKMKGAQLASIYNRTHSITGFQGSGVMNHNQSLVSGAQVGCILNLNEGVVDGVQISGIFSYSNSVKGAQISGIISRVNMLKGSQVSGIVNIASDTVAVKPPNDTNVIHYAVGQQIAGITNIAKRINGVQISAICNLADTIKGTQVSAIFNRAKKIKGLQVGIVNYADSSEGLSIGLLSIVRNGVFNVDITADELFHGNISVRTGSKRLYNIISVGTQLKGKEFDLWGVAYGLGTSFSVSKKSDIDINVTSNMLFSKGTLFEDASLYRIYLGIDRSLCKHLSLVAGITANLFTYTDASLAGGKNLSSKVPYTIWKNNNSEGKTFCGWIGARVGLRLF